MSADDFCINKFVPGYFSRINEDGSYSNGSGCGNDTASERNMVRKYIVDSVCYWADEYHMDGFRFDLVGLLDTDTINEIVEEVHKAHLALRLSTSEDVKKYAKSVEGLGDNIVGINIKGGQKDESAKEMYLLFNANTDKAKVTIPEGKWKVCINGQKAGVETIETIKGGEYTMDGISALVLVKQDGAAMTIVIVLIAAVVVVAAGVVIVVMKKKKTNR